MDDITRELYNTLEKWALTPKKRVEVAGMLYVHTLTDYVQECALEDVDKTLQRVKDAGL